TDRPSQSDRHLRKQIGTCNSDRGSGRTELGLGEGNVLIGDIELLDKRVEFGVTKHLPPVSTQGGVLRFGFFPAGRRWLFEICGKRGRWRVINGPDLAAGEKGQADGKNRRRNAGKKKF